jgi:hypothetical protein
MRNSSSTSWFVIRGEISGAPTRETGDVLSTNDFDDFMKYPNYLGCLPHDQLPEKLTHDGFGVINLDNASGPGTRWVGYFSDKKDISYFDSFGVRPDDRTIAFLKTRDLPILYNTSDLQKISSNRCGWFVRYFLKSMLDGNSFYDTLYNDFTQIPSDQNEATVK